MQRIKENKIKGLSIERPFFLPLITFSTYFCYYKSLFILKKQI